LAGEDDGDGGVDDDNVSREGETMLLSLFIVVASGVVAAAAAETSEEAALASVSRLDNINSNSVDTRRKRRFGCIVVAMISLLLA